MLFGRGSLGIMLIEEIKKQIRLDDLWARLYLLCVECDWLRRILFPEQSNSVLIGQSCSTHTVIMKDATLSLFAASMGLRIQCLLEDGLPSTGEILLTRICDQYGLFSEKLSVAKSLVVPTLIERRWSVRILDPVAERMKEQALASGENETGGCLIGSVFLAAKSIIITDILPPPPDSISTPSLFILGTEGLEKKIKNIEQKSNAKVTYLGTWHSHPRGGAASSTDKKTAIKLLFVRNYEPTVCLIWTPTGIIQV
jgi:integrative and conjugative element protein (TIGR02256 family)